MRGPAQIADEAEAWFESAIAEESRRKLQPLGRIRVIAGDRHQTPVGINCVGERHAAGRNLNWPSEYPDLWRQT
jgi:hypothetical protein